MSEWLATKQKKIQFTFCLKIDLSMIRSFHLVLRMDNNFENLF